MRWAVRLGGPLACGVRYKNLVYINSKVKDRSRRIFAYRYLESFTAKILVSLTAFTKLIVIFYPGDRKL